MKRIIVSVTNDLTTDQRVHKICTTLLENDFEVYLIGRKLNNSISLTRNYQTFLFKLIFNKGFLFYAEYNIRLFFKLLFLKKDILWANDLDTLLPNYLISVLSRKKLIYDSHELFTEVPELIDRPFQRNFWRTLEKISVPKLKNCITVSESIAQYYFKKHQLKFNIIRNFPTHRINQNIAAFPFEIGNNKIILYQGTLNKGRGLELMIDTMPHLSNVVLVIIGNGDIEADLYEKVKELKLTDKVYFLNKIKPEELVNLTPNADLGLSIEEDLGLNYRYALPNKLFDYIQANVPVLVSNLPEMRKIVEQYEVGEFIKNREPIQLAQQIERMLSKGKEFYKFNLEAASNELNWENESKKLIEILNNLE